LGFVEDSELAGSLLQYQKDSPERFYDEFANREACVLDVKAGKRIRLTNSIGDELTPMLSPDRRQLVFSAVDIMLTDLGTGSVSHLTRDMTCSRPRWNNDNTKIAFLGAKQRAISEETSSQRDTYGANDVYLLEMSGWHLVNLTETSDISEFSIDWSPDCSQIVCLARNADSTISVKVIMIASNTIVSVPVSFAQGANPEAVAWSNETQVVTAALRREEIIEFVSIDLLDGRQEVLGAFVSPWPIEFDLSTSSGQLAMSVFGMEKKAVDEIKWSNLPIVRISGMSPVWSHDSSYVSYSALDLPIGFVERLKDGRVTRSEDPLIVIKEDGTLELGRDSFREFYPVAKEVHENGKSRLVNISESDARKLIEEKYSKSVSTSEIWRWGWEK
jgi:hypothetical protein